MAKLLITIVPAVWIALIAIISVQNATPVSVKFITFRSIEIPLGVAIGFLRHRGDDWRSGALSPVGRDVAIAIMTLTTGVSRHGFFDKSNV